jgi:hypothetical protein
MDMEKANHKRSSAVSRCSIPNVIFGLGILSGAVYLFNFKIYQLVPELLQTTAIHFYVAMFLFLSALYMLGVFLVLRIKSKSGASPGLVGIILFLAVVFRLCLVSEDPAVLSKDMYRYIWDGRIQQSGVNPYLHAPAAKELKPLRDDHIFPNINRKDFPTLYPAGAQIFFRISYALAGASVSGYKGLMVFFDILTLLVLAALLKTYGFDPARVIVYAWNPLVVFEIAYSGHLEGLTVFLMVAAFYLNAIHKKIPGFILLAFSSAVKLYPALLLASFLNRGIRIKGILTFGVSFMLLYLPYISAGGKLSGFLPVYLKNPFESFNLGLKYLLMHLIPGLDYYLISQLFIVALLAAGIVIYFKDKQGIEVMRYAYILTGLLIVLMPASLHPWYVILIIPFLAFFPNAAWLIFTITVTLSYLKYVTPQGIIPTWVLLAEYLPLFVLLAAGFIFRKMTVQGFRVQGSAQPPAKKTAGLIR